MNFDIPITSSFNENGGFRGSEQEKNTKKSKCTIFFHISCLRVPNSAKHLLTRMDPQGRAPKLPFPLTASPVKAHHPHGRVFEGTRCGQFGNPLWAVWEPAVGSLGESTFGDPLWAEASPVSVQNVSKMWLPRVPDEFFVFFAPRLCILPKSAPKGASGSQFRRASGPRPTSAPKGPFGDPLGVTFMTSGPLK